MKYDTVTERTQFPSMITYHGCKIGIEVGVRHGSFSKILLERSDLEMLYLVDTWSNGVEFRKVDFRATVNNVRYYQDRAMIIKGDSVKAAHIFADNFFDFIHIDADHETPQVEKDILAYWPKCKKGGLFTGHDYNRQMYPELCACVDKLAKDNKLKLHVTKERRLRSWLMIK